MPGDPDPFYVRARRALLDTIEAESVTAERPLIALSAEAAEALADALQRPGRRSELLGDALDKHRNFRWID
jgi:uncharacterized protein (DUF1778 family)